MHFTKQNFIYSASFFLLALAIVFLNTVTAQEKPFSNTKEMDAYFKQQTAENKFSGVILIAKDSVSTFHKAYGLADKAFKIPNKPDTKFNIGSINKSFTSVAIAKLIEEGKVSLDDPLGKYLTDFPAEVAEKVTIRHLLQMKAGWGDYWNNKEYICRLPFLYKVSDYMEFIKDMPLESEPGTKQIHCNTCFEVLGAIIEKVTGKDYYDYIRENIYKPAEMTNSDSYRQDENIENRAPGYTNYSPTGESQGTSFNRNNYGFSRPRGTPAGGGYSTAEDLLKYINALLQNKLLSESYTNLLLNRFEGSAEESKTPAGVNLMAGGAMGISAIIGIDFKQNTIVIVLSNYDMPVAMDASKPILTMLGTR